MALIAPESLSLDRLLLGYLTLEQPLPEFLSALSMSSVQAWNFSPLDLEEVTEHLDLEQDF